jgi:hypothetical protein
VNAVIDRPRAAGLPRAVPPARGQGKGQGYRGFHPALDDRCELALAEHLTRPTDDPAWERAADSIALAGRVVAVRGMPARHAAACQQLAAFLGVYDRYFRLPGTWRLTPLTEPESPLTWRTHRGDVVVDVVRTAPPSHPLIDARTRARLAAVAAWAEDHRLRLVGVRLLAMLAPSTSLLHDPATGFESLRGTALAGGLPLPDGVSR